MLSNLLLFIGNARFRPVPTSYYLSQAIAYSYYENVVKGVNESKARWFSYIIGTIGIELIGPKGAGTAVRPSRNMSRMNQLKVTHPLTIENLGVYTTIIETDELLTREYQLTAYNVYNTDYIVEQLTGKKNRGNSGEMVSDKGIDNGYKYWNKTTQFKNVKIYQRDDIINPNDRRTREN